MARIEIHDDPMNSGKQLVIYLEKQFDVKTEASFLKQAILEACKVFAENWLENNRDKVIERLNVDALANMILLEVAAQTKQDILKKEK